MTLILLLAMTLMMAFAPKTSAQIGTIQPEKTNGYITVAPTLVGVGQQLTVNLFVVPLPTYPNGQPAYIGFNGIMVTITLPDGTKDTFAPTDATGGYPAGTSQALGAIYFFYTPTVVGNYSISFTMPAQNLTDIYYAGDYGNSTSYTGCSSNTFDFTVQSGIVLAGLLNGYPWAPLPNANVYWSFPINGNNREWSAIAGDWTGVISTMPAVNSITDMRWQPYGPGPSTPHVIWTQYSREGGIVGGSIGDLSYVGTTSSPAYSAVVIMDGYAYYNLPNTVPTGGYIGQFEEINLQTGQIVYVANGTITNGIHLFGNEFAQSNAAEAAQGGTVLLPASYGHFSQPVLWGTVTEGSTIYWMYYDAITGVLIKQFNNCSAARLIDGSVLAFGQQGSYAFSQGVASAVTGNPALAGDIFCWNMTSVVGTNWASGIVWKEPAPKPLTYVLPTIFAVSSDLSTIVYYNYQQYWAFNAVTGASKWNLTLPWQANANEEVPLGGGIDDFIIFNPTDTDFACYSILTGQLLFTTPSAASAPWTTGYSIYYTESNDLTNMYIAFPDGTIRAYSLTDGHQLWVNQDPPSTEYTSNVVPYTHGGSILMGGLFYEYGGYEPSYELDPIPRFAFTICVNVTTGATVWVLNGGVNPLAAADGIMIEGNQLNGLMYGIGKGPSATTVTAQQQVGGNVLIQGSVFDKSPIGSYSATITAMYPNGLPAISDDNMSVWMDYLYMQNATLLNAPPNCNGVPVSLTAVDSNGNSVNIGTVTSDGSGSFASQWTPTTPGLYQVYATFGGSNSYYSSYAETHATVASAASTTTPAPTATNAPSNLATTSDLVTYIAIVGIAIIIAIAIVGLVLYRKK